MPAHLFIWVNYTKHRVYHVNCFQCHEILTHCGAANTTIPLQNSSSCKTETLYPLNTDSLCPFLLHSAVIPIPLSVSELDFSRYPTEMESWDTCPFMSGLFHFAQSKMFSVDASVKMGNFLSEKRKKVKSLSRV